MPYSEDKKRLDEMLPYMAPLARGANAEWTVTRGNANTVAFRIREALRIARLYPDDYPDLARFAGDYAINVSEVNKVKARRRTPVLEATPSSEVPLPRIIPRATQRPTEQAPDVNVDEANLVRTIGANTNRLAQRSRIDERLAGTHTALTIADVYRELGPTKPTLRFPEAGLGDRDLRELFLWATAHNPQLMIMHEPTGGVTVAIFDPMVAEFSYKPENPE